MKYPDEVLFCVKYLDELGLLDVKELNKIKAQTKTLKRSFAFTPVSDTFFTELAEKMRLLWPAGDKDGKWAWRDSVPNLAERLKTLWRIRGLGEYSVETCLEVARKYLARFETNAKYMQVLKYYILKQKKIATETPGVSRIINESEFANMLENATVDEMQQSEWDALLNNNYVGEGVLI